MDITITGNPYVGASAVVKSTGATIQATSRAAKMNEDKDHKVTNMKTKWGKQRPDLVEEKKEETKDEAPVDAATLMEDLELEPMEYHKEAIVGGFRKLKVNDLVKYKALIFYNEAEKTPINPQAKKEEKVIAPEVKKDAKETYPDMQEEEETNLMDQRLRYADILSSGNDIINTPDRFANPAPEGGYQPPYRQDERVSVLPSRSSRKSGEYANLVDNRQKGLEVGQGERVLNKIASLNHGNGTGASGAYEDALLEFNKSEAEKKATIDNIRKLEEEIANAQKALERQRAEKIASLKAKTEANKEETLEYTMHSEDLRQKLAELRSQLASENSNLN